jgi:ectoine hydroxylase-related dioxygenase (phytanoyl-CoA dioxygenase family)
MEHFDDLVHELGNKGIVKLEGFVAPRKAQAARKSVLDLAVEHGVYADAQWVKSLSRFGYPKPFRDALNALNRSKDFPDLIGDELKSLVEQLVGRPVTALSPGQQILFSLPSDESWSIPADAWHIDLPKFGEPSSPGLQAFTFLDDVAPMGGATLVIAGSHRLMNHSGELSSKELKRRLMKEDYFRSLFDTGRPAIERIEETSGRVGDVNLQVVELAGRVGDVYLMDLRVLHTAAMNSSDKARMMVTCRFPLSTIAAKFGAMG